MVTDSRNDEAVAELKEHSRRDAESHFWVVEKFFIIVLVATASLHFVDNASKAGQKVLTLTLFAIATTALIVYGTWCWSGVVASQEPWAFYQDIAKKRGIPHRVTFRLQQGFWFLSAFLLTLIIAGNSFQEDSQLEKIIKLQMENSAKIDRLIQKVEDVGP